MKDKIHNLVFFGSSDFSLPTLESLQRQNFNISLVVTQASKPAGRDLKLTPTPVKNLALEYGIAVTENLSLDQIKDVKPDIGVVVSYGKIIPEKILDLFPFGILNLHPSALPKYRGPAPLQYTILNGDRTTAVTIIKLDEKMDHGPILASQTAAVDEKETLLSLQNKLAVLGADLMTQTIKDFLAGNLKPVDQDENLATYSELISKNDGFLDWTRPAVKLERQIRAFNPWPGSFAKLNMKKTGSVRVSVWQADIADKIDYIAPGQYKVDRGRLLFQSGDKSLSIKKIQLPGKKIMDIAEFLRGYQNSLD